MHNHEKNFLSPPELIHSQVVSVIKDRSLAMIQLKLAEVDVCSRDRLRNVALRASSMTGKLHDIKLGE